MERIDRHGFDEHSDQPGHPGGLAPPGDREGTRLSACLCIVWEETYFIRLKFEGHIGQGRWFGLEVIESQPSTPNVDVLIGMDLLVRST